MSAACLVGAIGRTALREQHRRVQFKEGQGGVVPHGGGGQTKAKNGRGRELCGWEQRGRPCRGGEGPEDVTRKSQEGTTESECIRSCNGKGLPPPGMEKGCHLADDAIGKESCLGRAEGALYADAVDPHHGSAEVARL